jgi:hypothetical protein
MYADTIDFIFAQCLTLQQSFSPLLGKMIKFEISGDTYIEKCFRFIRVFTDEGLHTDLRKVFLVLRREHSKNITELIEKAGLIDYNLVLEERKRKNAEETALILPKKVSFVSLRGAKRRSNLDCKPCGMNIAGL